MAKLLNYEDRELYGADLWGISAVALEEEEGVEATVRVQLVSLSDPELPGPSIQVEFVMPTSPDQTLREIESAAFETASALLHRFGRETAQTLTDAKKKADQKALLRPKE